jgi:hypothetical protein
MALRPIRAAEAADRGPPAEIRHLIHDINVINGGALQAIGVGEIYADTVTDGAFSMPALPSVNGTTSAPGMRVLSRLNGWNVHSPVNASLLPSRAAAHDSGSLRFVIPSS